MNKKLVILAVFLVIVVGLSLVTWSFFNPQIPRKHVETIARNVNNQEEKNALTAAESISYSKLGYSEVYAPLAAFFASVDQIVVLDRNFEPVLIGVESGMAVA